MRSLYIHRHNQAMQTVPKAFAKGKHGSYLIIADVGRAEELAKLRVIGTRTTSELLPDSLFPAHLSPEQAQAARNKPRSDILVIKCSAREAQAVQKSGALRHRKGRQGGLLMAAMAATPIPDKLKEKTDQHTQMMELLNKGGYKAEFCPIILGVGDAVYTSNLASLNFLG